MKLVKLDSIFDIKSGNGLELSKLRHNPNGVHFISRTSKNNGVSSIVSELEIEPFPRGVITVAASGSVMESFLQNKPFYTSYHIFVLFEKKVLSEEQKLFYCACLRANKYRYSYGRQANKSLKNILVPSIEETKKVLQSIQTPSKPTKDAYNQNQINLTDKNWNWFRLDEIFEVKKGKRLTKANMKVGKTPFIGAIDSNNGISNYIDKKPIFNGNTITINYDGNGVAESYYQLNAYWALDSVNVLYPKFHLNPYIAMFVTTITKQEKYRFNYGRKWHKDRMEKSKIKLPVDSEGNPDWKFMEDYIKSLSYSKSIS